MGGRGCGKPGICTGSPLFGAFVSAVPVRVVRILFVEVGFACCPFDGPGFSSTSPQVSNVPRPRLEGGAKVFFSVMVVDLFDLRGRPQR